MLPDNLAGSYRRYKEDTNVFATWLLSTAEKCGYKSDHGDETSQPRRTGARLKGKARKEAKKAAAAPIPAAPESKPSTTKVHVSTKDILIQAEVVAKFDRPPVEMPMNICDVLQRAIRARSRCATWFRHATTDKDEQSNITHSYFIATLKKALEILEPCVEKTKAAGSSEEPENDPLLSTNSYGMLEVEDIGGDNLDITSSDIITGSESKASKNINICEIDIEEKVDMDFVVFCFFEDLQRIQEFLKDTWTSVVKGELDTITAALISNLAFCLARQTEDELISTYPDFFGNVASYLRIATVLHEVNLANRDLFSERNGPQRSLDEFIYYSTFLILYKYQRFGETQKSGARCTIPLSTMFSTEDVAFRQSGVPDMPAMLTANRNWDDEDMVISQILLDITQPDYLQHRNSMNNEEAKMKRRVTGHIVPLQFEDELTRGLLSLDATSNIRVSVVFGARALMDILKILGGGASAYEDLRQNAAIAYHALGIRFDPKSDTGFEKSLDELKRDWITDDATERAVDLANIIKESVMNNMLVRSKTRFLRASKHCIPEHHSLFETYKKLQPETIWPSKDRGFYYNQNPIYCRLEWLRIAIKMEIEGINFCNEVTSFFAVAHLYNALKQEGLIQGDWATLDSAIAIHLGHLFNGNLPTTHALIFKRFLIKIGISPSAFAPNCRPAARAENLNVNVIRGTANMLKPTEFSKALMAYIDDPTSAESLLSKAEIFERINFGGNKPKIRHHTPLEILKGMREWLPQIMKRFETPYIALSRQCSLLLVRIRAAFNDELGLSNKNGRRERAEVDPRENVATVLGIFGEAYAIDIAANDPRRNMSDPTSLVLDTPRLFIAARVMQEFLKTVDMEEAVKPFPLPEPPIIGELSAEAERLRERYLAGDLSPEVLNGLRQAYAKATIDVEIDESPEVVSVGMDGLSKLLTDAKIDLFLC